MWQSVPFFIFWNTYLIHIFPFQNSLMLLSCKNICHFMATQQHPPFFTPESWFPSGEWTSTIVCNLTGMEIPAVCASNTQIIPFLPPVARRWAVTLVQPVEGLCWDLDFCVCDILWVKGLAFFSPGSSNIPSRPILKFLLCSPWSGIAFCLFPSLVLHLFWHCFQ